MKKEEIESWDWERILLGQAPAVFLVEAFMRAIVMYIFLLVILRFLGKRMDAQLTITEFSVMILLGAIISVPMQMQDKGIVLGMITLSCVLFLHRSINWFTVKSKQFEDFAQGTMSTLVKNGILQLDEMQRIDISKQNLFAALREKNIFNLGKVKRVYFEACGMLNVYEETTNKPGLSILPGLEKQLPREQLNIDDSKIACVNCGWVAGREHQTSACKNCKASEWIEAVTQ